ncbi:MAG: replicative DNA helicase [Oscillospiraceae bacterium]|nr:replicative DNA helicase [Oscillospiraceae bacterium]
MPDDILLRQMPHSAEAEQSVLGSILIDSRCMAEVVSVLRGEDFYLKANREIYEAMFSMFNFSRPIDPVTVLDTMRENGTYSRDSADYVMELMHITPTAANVMAYAAIVRDYSLLRALAETGSYLNELAMESAGNVMDILDLAEKRIYALRQGRSIGGLEPVSRIIVSVYEKLGEAAKNSNRLPGLSTGLPDLDNFILGLNKSDLILIAARPGMGKTSLALNIAMHAAKHSGKAVAIFSLEMSKEQLCMRLLSGESFIDNKQLQTGRLRDDKWQDLAQAAASISSSNLLIDDNPTLTVSDMNAQCRRVKDLGLVVIDYLQLMQSAGGTSRANENRVQVVSDMSRMLKIMAKELNVPVICLSQLSRANEKREQKRPMLSDLRESGSIEQDADIVLGLYRDDYYNKSTDKPNVAECIVLKNRRGETGTIELRWIPEYTTFASVERRHEEE